MLELLNNANLLSAINFGRPNLFFYRSTLFAYSGLIQSEHHSNFYSKVLVVYLQWYRDNSSTDISSTDVSSTMTFLAEIEAGVIKRILNQ